MATWITHLRIGERVLKELNGIDERAFYVGSLAPDSGKMVGNFTYLPPKDVSHWKREGVSYEQRFEDNAEFFKKYVENEGDSAKYAFFLGYYVHILTDTMYVRDIIHPYIEKHGKPHWKENIEDIRKGWYEIDFRFLERNREYLPFEMLKTVEEFEVSSLDYFAPEDVFERISYAVDFYSSALSDKSCVFFTHDEEFAEKMIGYMSDDIIKILKNKHNICR